MIELQDRYRVENLTSLEPPPEFSVLERNIRYGEPDKYRGHTGKCFLVAGPDGPLAVAQPFPDVTELNITCCVASWAVGTITRTGAGLHKFPMVWRWYGESVRHNPQALTARALRIPAIGLSGIELTLPVYSTAFSLNMRGRTPREGEALGVGLVEDGHLVVLGARFFPGAGDELSRTAVAWDVRPIPGEVAVTNMVAAVEFQDLISPLCRWQLESALASERQDDDLVICGMGRVNGREKPFRLVPQPR